MCRYPIAMRILLWLGLCLCAASPAYAQEPIEWSPERKLMKTDFQGRMPAQAVNSSMSWLHIEASWECVVGELIATRTRHLRPVTVVVADDLRKHLGECRRAHHRRARAGQRTPQRDDARHAAAANTSSCTSIWRSWPPGRSGSVSRISRTRATTRAAPSRFRSMVAEIDRELQEEQAKYDRETSHGVNLRVQDQWTRRIRALLK